jgi:hypothetical protein
MFFGDRLYSSGAAPRLEVLARFNFGRALTGACLDHVLLATVSSFIHRCCSIRCSAIVPLHLHPCPLDDGRSTAEAAAVAAKCGSASGLTHRPDIHGRAEDQSEDFVCSMGVVVQQLHDHRAVPRFFARTMLHTTGLCCRYVRTMLHTTAGVHVARRTLQIANDARHSFDSNRVSVHIVSGHCGPLYVSGHCGPLYVSGHCGPLYVSGHCGPLYVSGHCGPL